MTSGHLVHNNSLSLRQWIHPITTELAFFLLSVWHSRQSNHVIKLQNIHYVILNAQKCHHSTLGHNTAQFVLHMFQCWKCSFTSYICSKVAQKNYLYNIDIWISIKLLADCWHAMLALHLEGFGFSVVTRSEESDPIHQRIQHQFLGSFQ